MYRDEFWIARRLQFVSSIKSGCLRRGEFELVDCPSKLGVDMEKQGYPQNLWITLWKTLSQTCQKGVLSGSSLFWLNLDHTSFLFINNRLGLLFETLRVLSAPRPDVLTRSNSGVHKFAKPCKLDSDLHLTRDGHHT